MGNETLICGITGERMKAQIFMMYLLPEVKAYGGP